MSHDNLCYCQQCAEREVGMSDTVQRWVCAIGVMQPSNGFMVRSGGKKYVTEEDHEARLTLERGRRDWWIEHEVAITYDDDGRAQIAWYADGYIQRTPIIDKDTDAAIDAAMGGGG